MKTTRVLAALAAAALTFTACGDDDGGLGDLGDLGSGDSDSGSGAGDISDDDLEEFSDAINDAMGAGGGGTLVFDGTEIPIDSATCINNGGRIDVGTVSPDFHRVFVTGEVGDLRLQILTPEGIQWFDGTPMQENKPTVTVDGNTITSTGGTFFNNQDDRLVVAEFTIECPNDL